jgi:hypothetical protein
VDVKMLRQIGWIILCVGLLAAGCQRTTAPEKRTGLDNDTRSYSYVSYPESKMVQAAKTVDAVHQAKIEYTGKNIIMDVYVRPGVKQSDYAMIEAQVRRVVTQSAPLNPFILHIHPAEESRT